MPKKKKINKPARSDEDKNIVRMNMIDEGRKLFVKHGRYGFSTHKLAEKLGMAQGNIYNYFKSKRELYIAIRIEDFKKLKQDLQQIANKHKGSYLELLKELAIFYLDLAKNDPKRFQMMFMTPPPPSDKIGPIEKKYERIDPLSIVKEVLEKAIKVNEIKDLDIELLAYYLYSVIHGAAYVERDFQYPEDILEPIGKDINSKKSEKFRKFVLNRLLNDIKVDKDFRKTDN